MIRLISTIRPSNSTMIFLNKLYNANIDNFTWNSFDGHDTSLFSIWHKPVKEEGIKNVYRVSGFNRSFLPTMDLMFASADACIFQSRFHLQQAYTHWGLELMKKPHIIIPNGHKIDDNVYQGSTGKVLFIGHFAREKNPNFMTTPKIDLLYLAVSWILKNTDYKIDIIGPGDHEFSENDRIYLNKNFHYQYDLSEYEAVLQPELFSVCSNVLVEAQCQGIPVVAFKSGGNEDITYAPSLCDFNQESFLYCLKNAYRRSKETFKFAKDELNIGDCSGRYVDFCEEIK